MKLPVSKEYGAWVSILTAFIAGIGIAGEVNLESIILLFGAMAFFLARMPLLALLRSAYSGNASGSGFVRQLSWFLLYFFTGVLLFSILLFKYKLTYLSAFLVLSFIIFPYNIYVTYKKGPRSNMSGISGALGVSFLSSFAYHVATGNIDGIFATLWLPVFLYLAGGILYVRARLGELKWRIVFLFQIITAVIVLLLGFLKFVPAFLLVAYIPSFVKSAAGMRSSEETVPRRLGRMELIHSVLYVLFVTIVYLPWAH